VEEGFEVDMYWNSDDKGIGLSNGMIGYNFSMKF
jgi:hypothetical protein